MKTLIINGSPRALGGTATLAGRLAALLPGEVTELRTYEAGIAPCIDCRYCWQHPWCAVEDGMEGCYGLISAADTIVVASPIYFAQLTGSLLGWASRLQCLWTARRFRGEELLEAKRRLGGVILVDGGHGPAGEALAMARRLLHIMGAEYTAVAHLSGTDRADPTRPGPEAVAQIERMAALLGGPR